MQIWQPLVHSAQSGLAAPKLNTVAAGTSGVGAGGTNGSSAHAGAERKSKAAKRRRFRDMTAV